MNEQEVRSRCVSQDSTAGGGIAPGNFSWIEKQKLAGMAAPEKVANLRYLLQEGIQNLITLCPEALPPVQNFPEIHWMEIPVEEFHPPTIQQIVEFIEICKNCIGRSEAVGVHCKQGKGRTGVMGACYFVHFHRKTPDFAISDIRLLRPGSIETNEQEKIVFTYYDYLHHLNDDVCK